MKHTGKVLRVVRGVVESYHGFLSAYLISQMLHISMNANSWQTKQLFYKMFKIVLQLVFKGKLAFITLLRAQKACIVELWKTLARLNLTDFFFHRVKSHFSLGTELHCFWREKKITIFKIKHFFFVSLAYIVLKVRLFSFVVSLIRLICSCKQSLNVFQPPGNSFACSRYIGHSFAVLTHIPHCSAQNSIEVKLRVLKT